jgi:anti-sigma28 factor (negative regulator of flagellin synthesis)
MQIHGTSHLHRPHGINPPHYLQANRPTNVDSTPSPASDQLEISPAALAAIEAAEVGEVRHDLVARIRSEIADGTYETPEKLDQAIDRVLDELA